MKNDVSVYEPNQRLKTGILSSYIMMIRNIVASRELIYQLFRRDFVLAYKKSFLGFSWVLISPIVGILSWLLLNGTGVLNPGDLPIDFAPYVLLTSSLWGLFMGFYSSAQATLDAGSGFINQVKFPHEALLVKQTAQHLANFSLTFLVSVVTLLIFGIVPNITIVLFPIVILPLFFLGGGIGLVMSVINVVTPDFVRFFGVFLGFVFYATPIIYSPNIENPLLQSLIQINPLTYLIGAARDIIVSGSIGNIDRFLATSIVSFVIFLISLRLFFVSEDKVIERMI